MVFHSHSKSETPPPNTQNSNQQQQHHHHHHHNQHQQHHNHNHMASSSAMKSQPLHNFSLPDLKWAMNHTNRLRKSSDPSHKSPDSDSDSDSETHNNPTPTPNQTQTQTQTQTQNPVLCEGVSNLKIEKSEKKVSAAVGGAAADHAVENNNNNNNNNNSEKKSTATDGGGRSKILIRFRTKNGKNVEEVAADAGGDQGAVAEFAEDSMPKTWNLRPRKPVTKGSKTAGGGAAGQEIKPHPNSSRPESTRSRHAGGDAKDKKDKGKGKEKEKEKKPKFSITLTKEEIEEDIFAMTGSKPSRRPKKRNKNVQKQLDVVFPGLWLSSITPDSYKVHDTPSKLPKN